MLFFLAPLLVLVLLFSLSSGFVSLLRTLYSFSLWIYGSWFGILGLLGQGFGLGWFAGRLSHTLHHLSALRRLVYLCALPPWVDLFWFIGCFDGWMDVL
jgi:cell division protein FtsX